MGKLTIGYGIVIALLGVAFYFATGGNSFTALIPTFLGIPVIACGLIAEAKENLRMHAMHVAVLLGLFGLAGGAGMGIPKLIKGDIGPASIEQTILGIISAIFVALCVKSFIDARKRRKVREAAE